MLVVTAMPVCRGIRVFSLFVYLASAEKFSRSTSTSLLGRRRGVLLYLLRGGGG